MVVSWPWVCHLLQAYAPTPNSRRQQAPQDIYVNASANSTSVTIEGLDEDLTYSIAVTAATRAGLGVQSVSVEADVIEPITTTASPTGTISTQTQSEMYQHL